MLARSLRVASLELRTGFRSIWYYLLVALVALFTVTLHHVFPDRSRLTVTLTGGLPRAAADRLAASLSRDGFPVALEASFAPALDRVARGHALAALRFDRTGAAEAYVSSGPLRAGAERALRVAALRAEQAAYEAGARRAGLTVPRARVEQRDELPGVNDLALVVTTVAVANIHFIGMFWAYLLTVMLRGSFSRLRREFAPGEIVLGKTVSGVAFMVPAAAAMLAVVLACGVRPAHPAAFSIPAGAAALVGTLEGTFFAAIALSRPPREERVMVAGFVALLIVHTLMDAASQGYVSEAAMAPANRLFAPLNSLYQVHALARAAVFHEEGILLPGALARAGLVGLSAALWAAGGTAVLRRA